VRDDDGFAVFAAAGARRLRHAGRLLTGDDARAERGPDARLASLTSRSGQRTAQ
jgi:hypothetical protein